MNSLSTMKTHQLLSVLWISVLSVISCTQINEGNGVDGRSQDRSQQEITTQEVILTATAADSSPCTKSTRGANGEFLWSPGDEINLFYGPTQGYGSLFTAQNDEPVTTTTFGGTIEVITGTTVGSTDLMFWGTYPFSQNNTCDGNSVSISLQDEQTAVNNSWGEGALASVGKSQGLAMGFYNVVGGIKFFITEPGIRRIVLKGKNNEILAGRVSVTMSNNLPTITAYQDNLKEITLFAPTDPVLTAPEFRVTTSTDTTWYYITVPPVTFNNGFTLTLVKDATQGVKNYSSRTINRNKFQPYGKAANDGAVWSDIPLQANQIRYTATEQVNYSPGEGIITYGNVVESNVFNPTTHVGTITFANAITGLDHDAFSGNENLISVTLPDGLEEIEFRTFYQCPNLVSVDIPSSVNQIGPEAFRGCTSLEHIHVPEMIGLGVAAFANCTSLLSFSGPHASADGKFLVLHLNEDLLMGCALKSFENQDLIIPEGIDNLKKGVFAGGQFASVSIPETVKEIEESCFESCVILSKTLTIPHSVTSIGPRAFCDAILNEITFAPVRYSDGVVDIPHLDIPSIGNNAFDTNGSQRVIRIPGAYALSFNSANFTTNPWMGYKDYIIAYQADNEIWYSQEATGGGGDSELAQENSVLDENGSPLQFWAVGNFYPDGTSSSSKINAAPCVSLPAAFHETPILVNVYQKAIHGIGTNAFRQVAKQYISLPDGVTSIGDSAFYQCTSLQAFPSSGAQLTFIGKYAFSDCSDMAFAESNCLNLSHVDSLGIYAFNSCEKLGSGSSTAGSILLLGPVSKIPQNAFYNCKELTHIYFSSIVVKTIDYRAFYGCEQLTAMNILNGEDYYLNLTSVKHIGEEAFSYCLSIRDIRLPRIVTVGKRAFAFTRKLENISFGRFLEELGELIFYDNSTDNNIRNYDKLVLGFESSYPTLVSAEFSDSPTFGYTSRTDYFWPKKIWVINQSQDVLNEYVQRLRNDWNEAITNKIGLHQIQ